MLVSDNKTRTHLATAEELPYKDDKRVDSQLHRLISELLHLILEWIWERRQDWFFGVDIGLYYDPDKNAIARVGLGIDAEVGTFMSLTREWLYWYNETGTCYQTRDEKALAQKAVVRAKEGAEKMAAKLRELGIAPDDLD